MFLSGLLVALAIACGGNSKTDPLGSASNPAQSINLCNCTETEPDSVDFRHAEKHIDLPSDPGQDIDVNTILSWAHGSDPAPDAPRSGRELQMFHLAHAYLQLAWENPGDCDVHLEVSETADKTAPRVIVEIPSDNSYCTARTTLQTQLNAKGASISQVTGEINPAIPVDVRGLAFQDFSHKRGSQYVATVWELHPSVMQVLP